MRKRAGNHVYRVMQFNEPVRIRPELNETLPAHADMLRYDRAFHDPNDPSRIYFPTFKGYDPEFRITPARWDSFMMKLEPLEEFVFASQVGKWITYVHPVGSWGLVAQTFDDYVKEHKLKVIR